ncbi:branched-chain amino acid ABC transporter permease [Microbacteriaceae bacterium K1510]|nr:branched-chain amino acid ABC transporter permease [Microbacteriaceae bacterium K1510]
MSFFWQCLIDSLLLGGLYSLMSIGLSLGFGVTRIINFAHGEMIMFGAYGAYFASILLGVDPLLSLPLVAIVVAVTAAVLFKALIEKVLNAPHINQILLLFGISLALQNVAAILWTGDARSVATPYSLTAFEFETLLVPHGRVIAFVVAIILIIALFCWLRLSELGRATRAVAENGQAATLMGINVSRMYMLSFGINAALGAATGAISSFLLTITPFMGFHMLAKAFAIVVLGGLGSVPGTIIGAFALAFAETWVSYYVPEGNGWAEGVAFIVLLFVLTIRPKGILGQAEAVH